MSTLCLAYAVLIRQPANTEGERILASVCMITGAFIFAYVVGSVCNIATSLSSDANEYVPRALDVWTFFMARVGACCWLVLNKHCCCRVRHAGSET